MKHAFLLATVTCLSLFGCSDDATDNNGTSNGTNGTTGTTGTTTGADGLSCESLEPMNPTMANLNNDDLVFDVNIPEGFEINPKTADGLLAGFQVGARVVSSLDMITFGYEFDQVIMSKTVVDAEREGLINNGAKLDSTIVWNGQMLEVYVKRDDDNRSDAWVFLPAATDGEFHRLLVTTFLTSDTLCPAQVTAVESIFLNSLRPKGQ